MRRTTSRREPATRLLQLFLFAVVGGTAACAKSPVAPGTTGQPPVAVQSISISGTTTLQHPGDTSQLDAVATFADGTIRNVSSEAGWTVDQWERASVLRGGLLTARAYGECHVTVVYGSASARVLVRVVPNGMFLLAGRVTEESGLPLWQARVRLSSSPDQTSTVTNTRGVYSLPASGESEVRVEMDDFEPQLKRVTVTRDEQLDFQLAFNRRGFGGVYRLMFSAAASCALPADAMRRAYIARITEMAPGALVVALSAAEFVVWGEAGFVGRRDGTTLRFDIASEYIADYQFIEWLDPDRELAFSGTAIAAVGDTFIAAFSGTVVVRRRSGSVLTQCEATDHRLEFTR